MQQAIMIANICCVDHVATWHLLVEGVFCCLHATGSSAAAGGVLSKWSLVQKLARGSAPFDKQHTSAAGMLQAFNSNQMHHDAVVKVKEP